MSMLPTGAVTFLFTDIEGSTTRWEHQPEAMRVVVARHDGLIRAAIREHGGHVVKTMGDAFHAAFGRPLDGVLAALDAQQRLQTEAWSEIAPEIGGLRVRMALHTGVAEERDGDYYGPALNRAARLLAAGHGGQALLSLATCELVRDVLPTDVSVLDLGEHRLKDLIRPERVFQVTGPGSPTAFPPLRTLDARPHNLPVHPTALLGRDVAVSEVRALFARGVRLVTLTGPGGTGKTRLSQQVAAELLDQLQDGVWLVELAPIADPALVPVTIAQTLGLRDFGGKPALDVVREHLRSRSSLLLLDNFEQIIPAASVVSDLLAASPGLRALVTSREPLRLRGEVEYPVQPLALPDASLPPTPASLSESAAVALFVERASAVRTGFTVTEANAPAIAEVCRRLDGLPLAIELAAARVRLLTPEAIVSRLDRRLPLLTGGARDLPARQQTLRDAIAWSHDLLDESERRLFRRLGVFVGGWTLEAAESVVPDGPWTVPDGKPVPWLPPALTETLTLGDPDGAPDVLSGLDSLVAKSLVKLEEEAGVEPRFRMLETIREYALEQLAASGEEAIVRRRHLVWLADLVVQGEWMSQSPYLSAWMERLALEHGNVRAALAWSLADSASASAETGLWLAGALQPFWFNRDLIAEACQWFERLLAANPASGPGMSNPSGPAPVDPFATVQPERLYAFGAHPRVIVLSHLGMFSGFHGNTDRSIAALEEAVALARRLGDGLGMAHALVTLGQAVRDTGDHARAIVLGEEGAALARAVGDPFGVWRTVGMLGDILRVDGQIERAMSLFEESLAAGRRLGGPWVLAQSLRRLGMAAWLQGDLDRATTLLEEAVERWEAIDVKRGRHWAACSLGQIALQRGHLPRARHWYAEGVQLCYAVDHPQILAASFEGAAATLAAGADGEERDTLAIAARLLGVAATLRARVGRPIPPIERPVLEQVETAARAGLGDAAFEAARAEGAALPLDEAVDFAVAALAGRAEPARGGRSTG